MQLRPSPMRVSAKSREPLTFRVRGDVPYAPSSIDALDSDGPVHWAWRPPGWLDTHARLTLVPTRPWAGLRTGTLSLRAATSEQPRVATWRAAAVDPVRTRFRRSERSSQHVAQGAGARDTLAAASTGGAVDDVVEVAAAMACVVSLSRWSGTTRRDGAGSRIGVRHVLAPRDRLVVQPAAPIGIGESVAVATASGFEQVIRRKP